MGYKLICRQEGLKLRREEQDGPVRWIDNRWNGYLSNVPMSDFRETYEVMLPEMMRGEVFLADAGEHADALTTIHPDQEYPVRAAARYAVEENHRVKMVANLLRTLSSSDLAVGAQAAGLEMVGEIFCQSHSAYRECGLGSDACDELVGRVHRAGLLAAKMTGGGGGGVVAVLGTKDSEALVYRIADEYGRGRGTRSTVFSCCNDPDAVLSGDTCGAHPAVGQWEAVSVRG